MANISYYFLLNTDYLTNFCFIVLSLNKLSSRIVFSLSYNVVQL